MINIVETVNAYAKRMNDYMMNALGIRPEEPPVITDHPPIHMVDGEPKLGEPQ